MGQKERQLVAQYLQSHVITICEVKDTWAPVNVRIEEPYEGIV